MHNIQTETWLILLLLWHHHFIISFVLLILSAESGTNTFLVPRKVFDFNLKLVNLLLLLNVKQKNSNML